MPCCHCLSPYSAHLPKARTSVASPALAVEVVNPLHAVLGAMRVTGVGEALIDIALTSLPDEAWWAGAAIATHLVHTGAIVEALGASSGRVKVGMAVINIDLTVYTCRVTRDIFRGQSTGCTLSYVVQYSRQLGTGTQRKRHSASGVHLPTKIGPTRRDGMSSGWILLTLPRPPLLPCVPLGQEHL